MISEVLRITRSFSPVRIFYGKIGKKLMKFIKQIMKAYENRQPVFQKYDISNRDILRTFQ